ncbi:MAG: HAD family hydrolase [Paramuribaculum sp.]|nr:HAD family hydrolase [Paramuribaculum sp.]
MKQLVIFDLDGTLLNTITDLADATNHALESFGFPTHPREIYPMLVGNGITRLIERALPEEHRDNSTIAKIRTAFMEYYSAHLTDFTVPYPGIPELLDELTSRGVKVAVASNKYQEAVATLITHFFPRIPWVAVEGQKEGVPTKPDPSIVFQILYQHPTPKSEVLYVGDSGVDMETARRACVDSVGVAWGFRPKTELEETHADHIITSPSELIPLLDIPR